MVKIVDSELVVKDLVSSTLNDLQGVENLFQNQEILETRLSLVFTSIKNRVSLWCYNNNIKDDFDYSIYYSTQGVTIKMRVGKLVRPLLRKQVELEFLYSSFNELILYYDIIKKLSDIIDFMLSEKYVSAINTYLDGLKEDSNDTPFFKYDIKFALSSDNVDYIDKTSLILGLSVASAKELYSDLVTYDSLISDNLNVGILGSTFKSFITTYSKALKKPNVLYAIKALDDSVLKYLSVETTKRQVSFLDKWLKRSFNLRLVTLANRNFASKGYLLEGDNLSLYVTDGKDVTKCLCFNVYTHEVIDV